MARLAKKKIDIGEPFTYTVTLFKLKDTKVNLDKKDIKKDKNRTSLKNLNIIDVKEEINDYNSKKHSGNQIYL